MKHAIKIDLIVGAPKVLITNQSLPFKVKLPVKPIFHPKKLSEIFDIPFYSSPHNSRINKKVKKNKT